MVMMVLYYCFIVKSHVINVILLLRIMRRSAGHAGHFVSVGQTRRFLTFSSVNVGWPVP